MLTSSPNEDAHLGWDADFPQFSPKTMKFLGIRRLTIGSDGILLDHTIGTSHTILSITFFVPNPSIYLRGYAKGYLSNSYCHMKGGNRLLTVCKY